MKYELLEKKNLSKLSLDFEDMILQYKKISLDPSGHVVIHHLVEKKDITIHKLYHCIL